MAKRSSRRTKKKPAHQAASTSPVVSDPDEGEASRPAPDEVDAGASPRFDRLHVWQIQAVRDVLSVAAVVAIIWAGYALRAVTVPLLVALMLAYLFEPLIQKMTANRRMSRSFAAGSIIAALCVLVIAVAGPLLALGITQVDDLQRDLERGKIRSHIVTARASIEPYSETYAGLLDPLIERLPAGSSRQAGAAGGAPASGATSEPAGTDAKDGGAVEPGANGVDPAASVGEPKVIEDLGARIAREVSEQIAARDAKAETNWFGIARGTVKTVITVVVGIIGFGLMLFLIPFYFFFFSVWYRDVLTFGRDLIPKRNRARTLELLSHMDRVVAGFVRGRIVISLIMGLMLAVGWMLCGVPYALPLGLLVGVFCAVPYLGTIGIPIATGLALLHWFGPDPSERGPLWFALIMPSVVFGIVQGIEGWVLTPMIAGKVTKLDPVTVFVAVLAGGSVLGVYGMLLAIPVAACGKILIVEVLMPRIHAWVRGEASDPLPISRD